MKKLIVVAACVALASCLMLVGCGEKKSEPASQPAEQQQEQQEQQAGTANPWSDCASLEEANEVSGLSLEVNEAPDTYLGEPFSVTYRAMEGMVEVTYEYPASQIVVRKGNASLAEDGDISGEYAEYPETWTMNFGDPPVELTCQGFATDTATKTIWAEGDLACSILAIPLGGEEEFGIPAEAVQAFAAAVR